MLRVNQIINKYFKNNQPENVQRKFLYWIKSPIHKKEKEQSLFRLWEEICLPADSSTETSYEQVMKRLLDNKMKKRRLLLMKLTHVAAFFLVSILSVFSTWLYIRHNTLPLTENEIELVECYIPNGEIHEILLPDNSRVIINSGSSIFYNKTFADNVRDVYLSGEAKFIVSKDEKRPFVVKTKDMVVEALGTTFNISSYPNKHYSATTLVDGGVRVNIRSSIENFILKPGEQILFDKETGLNSIGRTRIDYILAWEKGQMVFRSASLYTIIEDLERRYDVSIYLNSKSLGDEKLTVKFMHDETIDDILNILQQIIKEFNYKIEDNKIFIY